MYVGVCVCRCVCVCSNQVVYVVIFKFIIYLQPNKSSEVEEEENEEEFLSPESESDHEGEEQKEESKESQSDPLSDPLADSETKNPIADEVSDDKEIKTSNGPDAIENKSSPENIHSENSGAVEEQEKLDTVKRSVTPEKLIASDREKTPEKTVETDNIEEKSNELTEDGEVGEAVEEPVMVVTGEGNGVDCESSWADFVTSYIIGDEISEPVMYFYGEGCGYDNETGNPETIDRENSPEDNSAAENGNDECHNNGEHFKDLSNASNKSKVEKNIKLRSISSVTKRSLRKQNDTTEVLNPDSKKHCVRDIEQSDGSNSSKKVENDLKREPSVANTSPADIESPKQNNVKKSRSKVKKKSNAAKKLKIKNAEVVNSETDNYHDSKTSIIEKRKSSVSSVDQEDTVHTENEKEKSPEKDVKVEDPLPPKKLRLETTPESDVSTHSKEIGDDVDNSETKKDIVNNVETPITERKKIKVKKGKFRRKNIVKNDGDEAKNSDKDTANDNGRKECKSLKRSLLDTTVDGNKKTESQSESEDDEPISSGKRLKFKPKKIMTSTR